MYAAHGSCIYGGKRVALKDLHLTAVGVYRIRFAVGTQKYDGPSFDVEMLTDELSTSDQ